MQTSLLKYYSYTRSNDLNAINSPKIESLTKENTTEKEKYDYIQEALEIYKNKNLYEKYAISINIIMNKELITQDKDILQELCKSLIEWTVVEKNNLEKLIFELNNNLNIYININIFIGLLINLINLLEISNITINNLIKNQFIKKLNILFNFLKCCLIPNFININPKYKEVSLKFLIKKFEKILSKWKKQADCYELSQKIIDFFGKRKSSLLGKKKLRENTNDDDINNSSTESGENFIKDLNNKKVEFDLHENETYYYDQNDIVSS